MREEIARPQTGGIVVVLPERLMQWCFFVPVMRALIAAAGGENVHFFATTALFTLSRRESDRVRELGSRVSSSRVERLIRSLDPAPALLLNCSQTALKGAYFEQKELFQFAQCLRAGGVGHAFLESPDPRRATHEVERYLEALEGFGISPQERAFFPQLRPADSFGVILIANYSEHGKAYQRGLGHLYRAPLPVLPPESFALCHYDQVALARGELVLRLDPLICAKGTDPVRMIEHLAEVDLVVAPESDLLHLAAYLGVPVVALFGPGNPAETRPLGAFHRVVSASAECQPCLLEKCPIDQRCTREISQEEVLKVMINKLQRSCQTGRVEETS